MDPMKKKPLHYYKADDLILSLGSYGCNMKCDFCQNNHIAQRKISPDEDLTGLSVDELLKIARDQRDLRGNIGLAFTYNEPSINYEYLLESAKKLKDEDLDLVLITNGNINKKPLEKLLPYVDAMNIDLKTYDRDEYKRLGGDLDSVKDTIRLSSQHCHVEVTYLAYPRKFNMEKDMEGLSEFISKIDKNIPLHITRFFPAHKLQEPATDINLLYKLEGIASKKLNNVRLGNI